MEAQKQAKLLKAQADKEAKALLADQKKAEAEAKKTAAAEKKKAEAEAKKAGLPVGDGKKKACCVIF